MELNKNESFPWDLEKAAQDGFGAAAWTKEDGSRLWIERGPTGFEAAAFWGGELALGATWVWTWVGGPGSMACALSKTSGPQGLAMEAAGLGEAARHGRVMEIMGAMAMGPGTFASVDWSEWKELRAAGLGLSREARGKWARSRMEPDPEPMGERQTRAAARGPSGH